MKHIEIPFEIATGRTGKGRPGGTKQEQKMTRARKQQEWRLGQREERREKGERKTNVTRRRRRAREQHSLQRSLDLGKDKPSSASIAGRRIGTRETGLTEVKVMENAADTSQGSTKRYRDRRYGARTPG